MGVNAERYTHIDCDVCNGTGMDYFIGNHRKAIKLARKSGWKIGKDKVVCPECRKEQEATNAR